MSQLIDTTEMYLRTIYELLEEGISPRRARIVERLHQTGPTVSQTVARMERDGLLTVDDERLIQLSPEGHAQAVEVMRKHRLVERLLLDVIGLDIALVHDEACRWEHVVSPAVEERLVALLGDPQTSPYGNPIPETGDDGASALREFRHGNQPLTEVATEKGVTVTVERIGEHLQQEPELREVLALGVKPGVEVTVTSTARGVEVSTGAGRAVLPDTVAEHLFVRV
ncbi:MAG TPA: metal-dependent transcriptional regulator [Propionibacteriaceae bacterium]|nr:metal-dependent transcriptional regulator [Propionibacteriaceae bacterium]